MIYDIMTLIGPKPLPVRFNQLDVFIRVYDGSSK